MHRRIPRIVMSRAARSTLLLVAPGAIVIALLAVVPVMFVIGDSVQTSDIYGRPAGGLTFDNYLGLFDPVYGRTVAFSLGMAALNTVICLVVGYAVAYYIARQPTGRQSILLLLVIIPFWVDFLVRTFAWIALLGKGGPIVTLLDLVGIPTTSIVPSQLAVVLGMVYAFMPTAVFPIYAAMRGIDSSVREAAADLGCGWWGTQARVLVPLCAPGLVAAAILTFIPTLGVFAIPVLLGGGKEPLVGNLIVGLYTEFFNRPQGAAMSIMVVVLMFASIALARVPAWAARLRMRQLATTGADS